MLSASLNKNPSFLPVLGLLLFRKSWRRTDSSGNRVPIFPFRLFRSNNGLQHLFKEFRDIDSNDDLRTNELLAKHSNLVMALLDEAICNIDNVDYTLEIIARAGKSHARFDGFTPDLFIVSIRKKAVIMSLCIYWCTVIKYYVSVGSSRFDWNNLSSTLIRNRCWNDRTLDEERREFIYLFIYFYFILFHQFIY